MTVTASKLGPQHFFYESKNVLIWQNIFTEKVVTVKNEFYQNKKTGDLTKNLHFFMIFGDKGAELIANNCQWLEFLHCHDTKEYSKVFWNLFTRFYFGLKSITRKLVLKVNKEFQIEQPVGLLKSVFNQGNFVDQEKFEASKVAGLLLRMFDLVLGVWLF